MRIPALALLLVAAVLLLYLHMPALELQTLNVIAAGG